MVHKNDLPQTIVKGAELTFITSPIVGMIKFLKGFTLSIVQGGYLGLRKVSVIKTTQENEARAARWERDARNNAMEMLRGIVDIINFVTFGTLNIGIHLGYDKNTKQISDPNSPICNDIVIDSTSIKTKIFTWINKPLIKFFCEKNKIEYNSLTDLEKVKIASAIQQTGLYLSTKEKNQFAETGMFNGNEDLIVDATIPGFENIEDMQNKKSIDDTKPLKKAKVLGKNPENKNNVKVVKSYILCEYNNPDTKYTRQTYLIEQLKLTQSAITSESKDELKAAQK